MKKFYSFFCAIIVCASAFATDYTICDGDVKSYALPIFMGDASGASSFFGSITQQIYLGSELVEAGASAGDITAISFYYTSYVPKNSSATTAQPLSRHIAIYLMDTTLSEYGINAIPYENIYGTTSYHYQSDFIYDNKDNKAGRQVFDGIISTREVTNPDVDSVKVILSSAFPWDGSKNIVMTVVDKTAETNEKSNIRFYIAATKVSSTSHPRFADTYWLSSSAPQASWITDGNYDFSGKTAELYGSGDNESGQKSNRSYVNKATFSITSLSAPSVPTGLAVSDIATTSASISWNAASSAASYELQSSVDGETWNNLASSISGTSYSWAGLTASTTYYVRVRAVNVVGNSDWSDGLSFSTVAVHTHNDITFEKWNSTTSLPTSGSYYLSDDVTFALMAGDVTLTGNLNLCLNGKTANLYASKIIVPDGKTLTIYDNEGGGKITGVVASEVGAADIYAKALICVYSGGTLVLKQGIIENNYVHDKDGQSYAIYSNGTLRLSGDVLINSNDADIYLYSTNVITLDGAINNSEKHTVWKNSGAFTSGWSTHMSGENPRDFFESANSARSVCLDGGEASLRMLLSLSESSNNSSISTYSGQVIDVNLTRSLTSSQYNTFCLPFALNNAQLEAIFGSGYDLEEFDNSSLEGEELTLNFNKVTSLTAGKPCLLKPSINVVNPSFVGVTITATSPADQEEDTYISFHGVYSPTELTGGNHNLLFLGADNELFWPESTGNLKGFRAYFEVKDAARKVARRARIVQQNNSATGLETAPHSDVRVQKIIRDGQLLLIRDNKTYNIQGQRVE